MTDKVIYEVRVKPLANAGERFVNWMQEEHIDDLLSIEGCLCCQMYRVGDTYICQYLFSSEKTLQKYINCNADSMRKKALERFKPGELSIERSEHILIDYKTKS